MSKELSYYGDKLQRLGQELQSLGYQLNVLQQTLKQPMPQSIAPETFGQLGATVARVKVQAEQSLEVVQALMFESEKSAARDVES